jgi:hypothetical protein
VDRRGLKPDDLLSDDRKRRAFVAKVLSYQRSFLSGQLELMNPYYAEYAAWAEEEGEKPSVANTTASPAVLVPPYFYFAKVGDDWYMSTLRCAQAALRARDGEEPVFPIVHFGPRLLTDEVALDRMAGDYGSGGFDGFFLWPNGFREERESWNKCRGLVRLVTLLADTGKPVFKLFGGFFSALLFDYGLKGFSCGLGYGMSKNAFARGGRGGKLQPQFYVPALHRSLALPDAERLLSAIPELRCGCKVCRGTYGKDMKEFRKMGAKGVCESHFLNARREELKSMARKGIPRMLRLMEHTAKSFSANELVDVGALYTWKRVLEEGGR